MKKIANFSKYLILTILISVPVFGHLEDLSIRQYDEGRLAISAIEMSKSSNPIIVTFENAPEMWSTKPPLMIWLQAICIKIFGLRELSIRLPTALAVFFTCCLLVYVSDKYLKKPWLGFIAVLVLVSTNGYIDVHIGRSGDYDALLTFFLMGYSLFFFVYSETKKNKHLYLFFACLTLAVLTKGVAGLMFLPAVFLFSVLYKQTIPLLRNKHFYIGAGLFLFFGLGYYFLREMQNPGYMHAVSQNELGGRFNEANDGHVGDKWYYYERLIQYYLTDWYLLVPCGILIGVFYKEQLFSKFSVLIAGSFILFFITISIAKTKLDWYAGPLYPLAAILAGGFIYFIFNYLKENNFINNTLKQNTIPYIFLFLLFVSPYTKVIKKTYEPKEFSWDNERYQMAYFLKDAINSRYNLQDHFYVNTIYAPQDKFYLEILRNKGVNVGIKDYKKLAIGDKVFVDEGYIKDYIKNNYEIEEVYTQNNIAIYKIKNLKTAG